MGGSRTAPARNVEASLLGAVREPPVRSKMMRRIEKQISDHQGLESIIHQAQVCRLALSDDNIPYIVPLCFGYADNAIYVHGALEGRKIDIIRKNPNVCVQFDSGIQILPAADGCKWGVGYRSVIAFGIACLIEDPPEKQKALDVIMRHYVDQAFQFPAKRIAATAVIKIAITHMTGKQSGI
jgi:uncharacterized protein